MRTPKLTKYPVILSKNASRIFACSAVRRIAQFDKKMQNEPNLKNTQINLTSFTEMSYANFHDIQHQKNEPKTNPINQSLIYPFTHLLIHSIMQNEPNLKNTQKNLTSFMAKDYSNEQRTMSNELKSKRTQFTESNKSNGSKIGNPKDAIYCIYQKISYILLL